MAINSKKISDKEVEEAIGRILYKKAKTPFLVTVGVLGLLYLWQLLDYYL